MQRTMVTLAVVTCLALLAVSSAAKASILITNNADISLANSATAPGPSDGSADPNVVTGLPNPVIPYTVTTGDFSCCGANYTGADLNNGLTGWQASSGLFALPSIGTPLTLSFAGTETIGSVAIYNGYSNRDDGTYTLKDGGGNTLGAYTISGTTGTGHAGTDLFYLTFNTPVTTNSLVLDFTSTEATGTASFKGIQVFSSTPEPSSLMLLCAASVVGLCAGLRRAHRRAAIVA